MHLFSRRRRIGTRRKKSKYRILQQNESSTQSNCSIEEENSNSSFEENVAEDGHQQDHDQQCSGPDEDGHQQNHDQQCSGPDEDGHQQNHDQQCSGPDEDGHQQNHDQQCSGPGKDGQQQNHDERHCSRPCNFENESNTLEDVCATMGPLSFYDSLRSALSSVVTFPYQLNSCSENIQIVELYPSVDQVSQPTVKLSVTIDRDLRARLFVHQIELPTDHDFWIGLPHVFDTPMKVTAILEKLKSYSVCFGSPDECFQSMVEIGTLINNNSGDTSAYREGDFKAVKGNVSYSSTIRNTLCKFLVQGARCQPCSKVRHMLWGRKTRQEEKSRQLENSPVTNYIEKKSRHVDMDRKALIDKIKQQKGKIKGLQDELNRQRRYFKQELRSKGVELDVGQNIEMCDLMASCQDDIQKAFPNENSLQRLFWEEQAKFASAKSAKGMRWHPMVIRWCLYLRQKSSAAYEAMRNSGFIHLPSARTLFDYSHYTKSALGFQKDVFKLLKDEARKKGMLNPEEPFRDFVGILFDEIKVRSDLVYDKHTGELIGYCDLDRVGNELLDLEKHRRDDTPDIAKFMLVLMVRGVAVDLRFPLAAFATTSVTADLLYSILWKAVAVVEINIKLKVLFFTCDGATPNRKFFNIHRLNGHGDELVYKTVNPHCPERDIYFISDVPHLLKTTRNCFANSFSHRNTRKLWKDGKDISWMHILKLYEDHCELGIYNPCPKLTRGHVSMTSYSCMKVCLAAQVMSDSVGTALEMMYGDNVSETINFIRTINKFFDCLNVRNLFEGRNTRNPNLNPYREVDDERLTWLLEDFLNYFEEWKQSIERRPGDFTAAQKQEMQLSYQTLNGLRITANSIVSCVRFMLRNGAKFVLTHAFNQDPLEQLFGHYRNQAGNNNNPSVYEVRNSMTSMRVVGALALAPRNGNIRGINNENNVPYIDNTPLERRPRNQ
ncbi:uncharacterized protein [Argopecten irradians]|uniref:uncharacterized protein n=1 Tax=Argopecten irradians TaxID=31199 RepID=UPI003715FADD